MLRMEIGRHIVSDPRVCGGRLTFRGTRVFVQDVLDMLRDGLPIDEIIRQWHGLISPEAIEEARQLVTGGTVREAERAASWSPR